MELAHVETRYRIAMHIPERQAGSFLLNWYFADQIPDICAMAQMIPGIEDIFAFNLSTKRYAFVGDESSEKESTTCVPNLREMPLPGCP